MSSRSRPSYIERWSLSLARYIHHNGGDSRVSIGTMRFALQLWISILLIFALTLILSLLFNVASSAIVALLAFGTLRYFSGGWHFRSLDWCVIVTTGILLIIALLPPVPHFTLLIINSISLLLIMIFAPTGHGQLFSSSGQRLIFKLTATLLVMVNFFLLSQAITVAFLTQSFTLLTRKGGN